MPEFGMQKTDSETILRLVIVGWDLRKDTKSLSISGLHSRYFSFNSLVSGTFVGGVTAGTTKSQRGMCIEGR
jgi:hypothetical protein